jgi:D-alanyl-D-alanine carboxypeptidase/D-alanyl-D-alanine-endopeptidase (penicillin-binding protein 4)
MAETLEVLNRNSQNLYASLLYKLSGAALEGEGSWTSGAHAVRAMLERRHIPDGGTTVMRDGSGLSPLNRASAAVLAQVLSSFDRDLLRGPLLYASLPVAGESGTLARRLTGGDVKGRVHAKTGTLNDVRARALAGYVDGQGDDPGYVFAILLNGSGASHGVVDDLVREIAR